MITKLPMPELDQPVVVAEGTLEVLQLPKSVASVAFYGQFAATMAAKTPIQLSLSTLTVYICYILLAVSVLVIANSYPQYRYSLNL